MYNKLTAIALSLSFSLPAISQEPSFPQIPVDILEQPVMTDTADIPEPSPSETSRSIKKMLQKKRLEKGSSSDLVTIRAQSEALRIPVEPGINQVIPIAIGHINRIVTPYDTPSVNTISDAIIEANENVLYIATNNDHPVTMFIKPDVNDETAAISLTLNPKKIPPIEVTLELANSTYASGHRSKKAEKWEKNQPYVDSIINSLKQIALKEIPTGYSIGPASSGTPEPYCYQKGLTFDFQSGQYLRGHNIDILIGLAENLSSTEIEFSESSCLDGNITAVSSWPNTYLLPGQKTEVYVMMRNDYVIKSEKPKRPSLLGDNQ